VAREDRYASGFFDYLEETSRPSAEVIAPLVLELAPAQSVIDVGCGRGDWLAVFRDMGVDDVFGVDGHAAAVSTLVVPHDRFLTVDLTQPISMDRRFDLVLCLEVAEHIPAQAADLLVDSLTRLGPVVLFSAAIPYQGGEHHVNEQWPEYWSARFAANGFAAVDCIRPAVWRRPEVAWWYRQNTILYVDRNHETTPALAAAMAQSPIVPLSLVHPEPYRWRVDPTVVPFRQAFSLARQVGRHALIRRLRRRAS
jgi:SAM-dependent methyltransferase